MSEKDINVTNSEGSENDQVTLSLDDGTEVVCDILAIFPCGDKEYIALFPVDGDDDTEIYLYRFTAHDDNDIELGDIDDDDEFEAVTDAFDELLDNEEFEELYGDDETEDNE